MVLRDSERSIPIYLEPRHKKERIGGGECVNTMISV